MKKNKSKKSNGGNLSPENYIKTRARNLPIGKCYLNETWEESGLPTIVVSRNHTNGNFTFAVFLVDLFCLGVKETFYYFNTNAEFYELLDKLKEQEGFVETDYKTVHNIIYGAIDYAESYGFKPHKDFEVSRYILEEDDDKIELMDIEFGYKGKPAIFVGKEKHPTNIIATLERTAGKGNFTIVTEEDLEKIAKGEECEDDDFGEEDELENEEIADYTTEDIQAIIEGQKKTSARNFARLVFSIYKEGKTNEEVNEMYEITTEVGRWNVVDEEETDEDIPNEIELLHATLFARTEQNSARMIPEIKAAIDKYPGMYLFYNLLSLAYSLNGDTEKENETIFLAFNKFPKKILALSNYISTQIELKNDEELKRLIGEKFIFQNYFPEGMKISFDELISLTGILMLYFSKVLKQPHKGIAQTIAICYFIFYGETRLKAKASILLAAKMMLDEIHADGIQTEKGTKRKNKRKLF